MPQLLIDNYSGGERRGTLRQAPNESSLISGFWHASGDLVSMRGPAAMSMSNNDTNSNADLVALSQGVYTYDYYLSYLLSKRGRTIWVDAPEIDFHRALLSGVVAQWDMKDTSDDCGNHVPGASALTEANVSKVKLWSGRVRGFDGISSVMTPTTSPTTAFNLAASARTVSLWIKLDTIANSYFIAKWSSSGNIGWDFGIDTAGRVICSLAGAAGSIGRSSTAALSANTWYHVAFTWEPGTYPNIYIDGVLSNGATSGSEATTPDTDHAIALTVGCLTTTNAAARPKYPMAGCLGTVSIYNVALTGAQILAQGGASSTERKRYGDPIEVSYTRYPLLGDSHLGVSTATALPYTRQRAVAGKESFAQIGNYVYMAPSDPSETDYVMCWRSAIVRGGTATGVYAAGGQLGSFTIGTGEGQYWIGNGGVIPGDIIYVKDHSGTRPSWRTRGHVIRYVDKVNFILYVSDGGWDTTGKGAGATDAVDYVIVRVHRAGIQAGTTCTAGTPGSSGGTLPTGKYKYCWRYGNSLTGYWGDVSAASDVKTVTVGQTVAVSGWDAQPQDQDVNKLEIYRMATEIGGVAVAAPAWKLVKTVSPVTIGSVGLYGTVSYRADLAAQTDDGWVDGDTMDPDAVSHARPGVLRQIRYYNSRLVGAGAGDYAHRLYFSTINAPDYMPLISGDYADIGSGDANAGGYVLAGASMREPIVQIIPETGAFDITGRVGGNLLIGLPSRAVRLFGWDWSNFYVDPAFAVGFAGETAVNAGGLIIWSSGDHVNMLPAGSSIPQIVSRAVFPQGIREVLTATDKAACLARWSAVYWHGSYILSGSLSSAIPNTSWIMDVGTQTWDSYPAGYNDLIAWNKIGNTEGEVLSGSVPAVRGVAGAERGDVDILFSTDPSGTSEYRTRHIFFPNDTKDIRQLTQINRVTACFKAPVGSSAAADQTIAMEVYADGDEANKVWPAGSAVTQVLAHETTATGQRLLAEWAPGNSAQGHTLQLRFYGTITKQIGLEWILVEYTTHKH